jgi:Spy/CpxP family protein refolding chaperone
MESTNKKRLLIAAIILLLVINISALATFLFTSNLKQKRFEDIQKTREQIEFNGMHKFLKDELKLNEEQFQIFREAGRKYFRQNREIAQKLDDKRLEFINELTSNQPDDVKLDKISREIGDLHYELKKNTIDHYFELKIICNPEQQKTMDKLFMQMIQKEGQRPMNRPERKRNMGRNPDTN